jgi:hypothetical protein
VQVKTLVKKWLTPVNSVALEVEILRMVVSDLISTNKLDVVVHSCNPSHRRGVGGRIIV